MSTAIFNAKVRQKTTEAIDICSFELVDPDGGNLPAFSAGSHIDVYIQDGVVRQYSLCNAPHETDRYLIGVLRDAESRGGSQAMHDCIQVGDLIQISVPKNHFALEPAAKRSLLLAGGIGVTPLLCMAEELHSMGADFELHYSTRTQSRAAFLPRIEQSGFNDRVRFHFDDGPKEQQLDIDRLLDSYADGVHLYVCGPAGFLNAVLNAAKEKGWPTTSVHFEYFSAELQTSADDGSFNVKLASSGKVYRIAPDETIAACLEEQGVDVLLSCEQGVCGTCLTKVLEGEPDHRDYYLTDDERAKNDQILLCCSRAKTPLLVLDL